MSGLTPEEQRPIVEWGLRCAVVARQCGFEVDIAASRERGDGRSREETEQVWTDEYQHLERADLVLFVAMRPSTGGGFLVRMAQSLFLPVITVRPTTVPLSRMLDAVSDDLAVASSLEIDAPLSEALHRTKARLASRRVTCASSVLLRIIGQNIAGVRNGKGWSRKYLAQVCTMTDSFLRDIEAGKIDPSILQLSGIAHALGVNLLQLIDPASREQGKDFEQEAIESFFVKFDLGMGKYLTMVAAYELRRRSGIHTDPPTESELWNLFRELFPDAP